MGDTGEAAFRVGAADSARTLALSAGDDFPDVLATSRMIALMELASARAMKGLLTDGQLSVGVGIDVRHLAATPMGTEVRAVATFLGMEGKLFRFRLEAFDAGGLIGEGFHSRAIVATERLLAGAVSRNRERAAT